MIDRILALVICFFSMDVVQRILIRLLDHLSQRTDTKLDDMLVSELKQSVSQKKLTPRSSDGSSPKEADVRSEDASPSAARK